MDVISYLDEKGIKYELQGSEAILTCPNCNKNKLYVNIETLLYHCFRCETLDETNAFAKGHFSTIQRHYGDILDISPATSISTTSNQKEVNFTDLVERYHHNLLKTKTALKYLFDRGRSIESIKQFKLGYTTRYKDEWIVIPSYEDNVPKLLKLRNISKEPSNEKYIREKGSKSILFNGDVINEYENIIITEGEFDAMALIEAGFPNVVGTTGGAGTLLPEWYDKLLYVQKIIVCFDSDKVGQKAARDVWAKRLGTGRVWNLMLPDNEDIDSFLLKNSKEDFENLLNEVKQFKVDGISSLKDTLYDMYKISNEEGEEEVFKLPWDCINKLVDGGLHRSRLTVVGGVPGVGKSSYCLQICYYFAKTYDLPCLYFCLEMPKTSLAVKIIQLENDITKNEIRYGDALIYATQIEELPIYFGYDSRITPEKFFMTMEECVRRYGIELFVFDNLQLCIRSDKESDISKASKIFKQITMDLNIMGILISQPRKMNNDSNITYDILKGSSSIPADADEVLLLHRLRAQGTNTDTSFSPETYVIADKERFSGGGRRVLKMVGEKSRFDEFTKDENKEEK